MTTRERIHRWRSPSIFTLIALCSLLPFVAFGSSYDGRTSFTGIQLVTHASSTTAEIAFGAAVVGLVLGLLGVAAGPGWCAAVGLGALFLDLLFQFFLSVPFGSGYEPRVGYWLALVLFAWAGILHLGRWVERRP